MAARLTKEPTCCHGRPQLGCLELLLKTMNKNYALYGAVVFPTSNAMFSELAERSLMSLLAGPKHTHVRLASQLSIVKLLRFFCVC